MIMATGTKNVKVWISENLRTRLGAKVFLGLALGALLLAGTTMYFSISQGEAGSPSASGVTIQSFQSPADAGSGDLSESSVLIREEQRAANSLEERLERQIDSLLGEAARDPSRTTPSLNREIERLDDQIDMLRFNAMKDTSGGSPSYHAQRAADSLEERLEVQRIQEAMRAHSESRRPSYHQQRLADSIEERMEIQRVQKMMLEP